MADMLMSEVAPLHYGGRYKLVLLYLALCAADDTREANVDISDLVTMVSTKLDMSRADLESTLAALESYGAIKRLPDTGSVNVQLAEHSGRPVAESDRYHYVFASPIPEVHA